MEVVGIGNNFTYGFDQFNINLIGIVGITVGPARVPR